jgi:hypothetical protein
VILKKANIKANNFSSLSVICAAAAIDLTTSKSKNAPVLIRFSFAADIRCLKPKSVSCQQRQATCFLKLLDLDWFSTGPQSFPSRSCPHHNRKALALVDQAIEQRPIQSSPGKPFGMCKALRPSVG